MSQGGLVTNSSMTQSKANSELEHLLKKHREVRINAGQTKLLRVEADGGPDKVLWPRIFPELMDDVTQYKPLPPTGLLQAAIDEYMTFTEVELGCCRGAASLIER